MTKEEKKLAIDFAEFLRTNLDVLISPSANEDVGYTFLGERHSAEQLLEIFIQSQKS